MNQNLSIQENEKCDLIVIQPTSFCNIDCSYCYLPHRNSKQRINQDTISRIFEILISEDLLHHQTEILWHASEPLVLPISFYESAFSLIDVVIGKQFKLRHSFQTNATLITDKWCEFFKTYNVEIGVSFDGPKHIHDRVRVDRAGHGTYERVLKGVRLLQKHDLPFHVISVVTEYALSYPDEIFNFFVENNIMDMGFNFEEIVGSNTVSSLDSSLHFERCKDFLRSIARLQKESQLRTAIREFTYMSQSVLLPRERLNTAVTTPFRILGFDTEGNISTFCPELLTMTNPRFGSFHYGNVENHSIRSIIKNPKFLEVYQEIKDGIEACKEICEYFEICGGGTPSSKVSEKGSFACDETMFCKLKYQAVADIVIEELEKTLLDGQNTEEM